MAVGFLASPWTPAGPPWGGGGDPISTDLAEATAAQSHAEKRDFKQGNKPVFLISLHIV